MAIRRRSGLVRGAAGAPRQMVSRHSHIPETSKGFIFARAPGRTAASAAVIAVNLRSTAAYPARVQPSRACAHALWRRMSLYDRAARPIGEHTPPMTHVVTRFAPSPTGFLHIGGARTALFNWLYAKRFGGKFLLRIEDTDRERSTAAAVEAIIDGLKWLGLDWDGEAISQFARAERHREVARQLIASGGAYRCYASTEELEEMREKARL